MTLSKPELVELTVQTCIDQHRHWSSRSLAKEIADALLSSGIVGSDREDQIAKAAGAVRVILNGVTNLADAKVWAQVALDFLTNDIEALAEGAAYADPTPLEGEATR